MRLVLLGLAALVAAASAAVPIQSPVFGYHENIGIPEAERIKSAEEKLLANTHFDERIVGGAIAPQNAYPYLAGLLITFVNIAGTSVCGSSLVSPNRLVTAAHCWNDGRNQANQFVVVLGTPWLFNGGTRIPTSQVIMHPQWNTATLVNDIAMIYLPFNVMYSASIQPVELPTGSQLWDTFVGQWAMAAGFGRTTDQQVGASTVISHVSLQVITFAQCQAVFGNWAQPSNICTNGAGGVGICGGDSGGPLVVNQNGRPLLVGVSSFVASAGCQLGFPSAFARTTSFNNFILQHM